MEVLTGPQQTADERGDLAELAGFKGLTPSAEDIAWWDVTALYCARGWERCSSARADVAIAESFSIPVSDLK